MLLPSIMMYTNVRTLVYIYGAVRSVSAASAGKVGRRHDFQRFSALSIDLCFHFRFHKN